MFFQYKIHNTIQFNQIKNVNQSDVRFVKECLLYINHFVYFICKSNTQNIIM